MPTPAPKRQNGRLPRDEIDPAALELVARHGKEILATARRYSATLDDAEDAYQRGLEILLTKAPTTRDQELVPWLKTVVKHEAFAIGRQRERATPTTADGQLQGGTSSQAATHEEAERYEQLRLGAEALGRLKPQELLCLRLKAQGLSYKEICEATGFSYTKVNRCITEGRRAFLERVAGIEAGVECERLAPLLSALADGEASTSDLDALRPHLKSCLSCRARLKEFRAAPARVAALLPPLALAAQAHAAGPLRGLLESLIGAVQERAMALSERAHAAAELATSQKVAAVTASAAALAGGGGVGVSRLAEHPDRTPPRAERQVRHAAEQPVAPVPAPAAPEPAPQAAPAPASAPPAAPAPTPPAPPPPPPNPASEFAPSAASAAAGGAPAGGFEAGGGGSSSGGSGGGGGGEFAP